MLEIYVQDVYILNIASMFKSMWLLCVFGWLLWQLTIADLKGVAVDGCFSGADASEEDLQVVQGETKV